MKSFELERSVDRKLRALPLPQAPPTLLPRVMAAARAWTARPWYAREWVTWPLGWQAGSLGLLIVTLATAAVAVPTMQQLIAQATTSLISSTSIDVPRLTSGLLVSATTLRVIWQAIVQPFLPYLFAVIVLMSLASATVVLALNRVVFGRILHS